MDQSTLVVNAGCIFVLLKGILKYTRKKRWLEFFLNSIGGSVFKNHSVILDGTSWKNALGSDKRGVAE